MKKSLSLKLFLGLCVSSCLIGCDKKQEEQKDDSKSPEETTTYDDGYVDGYLNGYNEGKVAGYSDGFEDGKVEGYEDGYENGKEDGKEEQADIDQDKRSIHSALQLEYLKNGDYSLLPISVTGEAENSKPLPLEFELQESPLYTTSDVTSSKLVISESRDFAHPVEINGDENNHFKVYNTKINTKYYYYYSAVTGSGTFYSDIKEVFVKNEAPRLLDINGVTNARDDGGWKIKGQNKYTKQGLIYRMGSINGISTQGKEAFKALGIKTEIDLRNTEDHPSSTEIEGLINYSNFPLTHSNTAYFTNSTNKQNVKKVLDLMADHTKYPLMFHCNIGTDRTGFISFIVNALLGVEEEFLYRDYMMSNYAHIGGSRDIASIYTYISQLKENYGGSSSLAEGAKQYMLSINVSEETINNIKTIMLGA